MRKPGFAALVVIIIAQFSCTASAFTPLPLRIGSAPSPLKCRRRSKNVLRAIRLTSLIRYPIKSCGAEPLTEATITAEGVEGDRRFMVARHDGSYLTQREIPRLATIESRTDGADATNLRLRSGDSSIRIDTLQLSPLTDASLFGTKLQLVDQGEDIGRWLAHVLGPPPPNTNNLISTLTNKLNKKTTLPTAPRAAAQHRLARTAQWRGTQRSRTPPPPLGRVPRGAE